MCDLIPLSVIGARLRAAGDQSGPLFEAEGIEQVDDSVGRAALSCDDAARLIGARRAARAFADDQRRRQNAEWVARYLVARGVPAVEGLTAAEQMFAAGEGDRPKSVTEQLLDAELAHMAGGGDDGLGTSASARPGGRQLVASARRPAGGTPRPGPAGVAAPCPAASVRRAIRDIDQALPVPAPCDCISEGYLAGCR
jgi:hypothetical protein